MALDKSSFHIWSTTHRAVPFTVSCLELLTYRGTILQYVSQMTLVWVAKFI